MTPREELTALRRLAELEAKAAGGAPAAPAAADEGFAQKLGRQVLNAGAGALRGAGSIGATLLAPVDMLGDAMAGKGLSLESNRKRRQDMTDALGSMGADTESLAFGAGKIGGEIAGTAGIGGIFARGAQAVGAAPGVVNALGSAGFTTGAKAAPGFMGGATNLLTRSGAGAAVGGASAAMVDPETAGTGALIGGVLPGSIQALGAAGSGVATLYRRLMSKGDTAGAKKLAAALGASTPAQRQAIIDKLRSAETLVPGSTPTVAQALQSPESGLLQKLVYDSPGGGALVNKIQAQGTARKAALERVAPTVATGPASARADFGNALAKFAQEGDAAAKAKTSALYNQVPQDEAALYLPNLAESRDKYFGRGSFVDRAPADKAVQTAQEIGSIELPGIVATTAGKEPMTLAQAVRKAGGVSSVDHSGLRGEVAALRGEAKNLVRRNGGVSPARLAEMMHEAGYLADESSATLLTALRDDLTGLPQYSANADMSRRYGAMRDAAMGEAPGATRVSQKVTLREFDNLRKSIGVEQRTAGKAGNDPLSASMTDMRKAMDDRINAVVRGDGAIDENLPIEWANSLDAARKAKVDQMARYRTGPQRDIFRTGADGQPVIQGGEVAGKFWGNRPGAAEDVQAFRRLVADNPEMLGQFRSMVTTEGMGTKTAAGLLSSKYSKWVSQNLPGLREAFPAKDVQAMQRIAQDFDRHASSVAAGGPLAGSDTHQKVTNALSLGLLDSAGLRQALAGVPMTRGMGGVALDWVRGKVGSNQANALAGLMADAPTAANALASIERAANLKPSEVNQLARILGQASTRSLPVAASQ